ncbi:hypothetical protein EDD15DRAFT_2460164 [Pisolithus albus]|nr:hypothetical protein EDD15DRAFT_2460164 [Pisolithus albus]
MASNADEHEFTPRYKCTCSKYNFGRPHAVSKATFYRHINEVDTEEERARLRSTAREGLDSGKRSGAQSRHAAVLQAMAKRRFETVNHARQHVRRRKHTRSPDIDIPTHQPDLPETEHGLLDDEVDEWEVLLTPDLNGPIDEDALPFVPDRSDAEIDTQLDENFPPHVHDTSDAVQHLPDEEPATQRADNHPAAEVQTEQAGPLRTPSIQFQRRTRPVVDIEALTATATLPSMKQTMCFIKNLKDTSLDDPVAKLSGESLERLWNPQTQPISIESVGTQYSIATYLALENASQNAYNHVCQAARRSFSGSLGADDILQPFG